MKLHHRPTHACGVRYCGILLTECLVYISVFAILSGIATSVFYFCWDHTRAVVSATGELKRF